MRALVTGATGFVGAAVARALLREDWQVRALARPGSDRSNLAGLSVQVCEGDLTQPASLGPALQDCEALFHVAADYRLGVRDTDQLYRTNVEGTRAILAAANAAGVKRIVYTSSVAAVGIPKDGTPGAEETPVTLENMIGHYKRSKFLAEDVVREAARSGTPVVIVSPSTPVGPGDVKPTPTGQLVLDAAAGRMPAYVDTGLNLVHVDDVAAGHVAALEHGQPGRRYILGGTFACLQAWQAGRALHLGWPGHDLAADPARDLRAGGAQGAQHQAALRRGSADGLPGGGPRQIDGPLGAPDPGECAHVAQAHVLLERKGGA
jgi:dihydroflavonol-4-reductase